VLSLGFLVLTASALKPNHSLGVLLSAAIATCYAMTLLLLPSLLRRVRSRGSSP
jgi:predicted RND superfamily exporter protein